jgi:hypothetical protein
VHVALLLLGCTALVGGGFVGASAVASPVEPLQAAAPSVNVDELPMVLVQEQDGFRYEYHVPTGRAALYRAAEDPHGLANVLLEHPDRAESCRRALQTRLRVSDLESLRARYQGTIDRLKALGYL